MIHILLPEPVNRPLAFFLALEEWVARNMPPADYVFDWSVEPTVIIGRNQDLLTEVNVPYCREHGIDIVRRRSGGGCVFADRHNIMLSYVTPTTGVEDTFAGFTGRVAARLRQMGFDAHAGGRNDILVGDRKISGNAFYHLPGRSIVHGTMLYDTDITHMLNAITPSRAKLESKRVQSVATRIVTARELKPGMSFAEFREALLSGLEDDSYTLTPSQVLEVQLLEQRYYAPGWLEKSSPVRGATNASGRFEGVGNVAVTVALDSQGRIARADVHGDFLAPEEIDTAALVGLQPGEAGASNPVPGLADEDFAALVAEAASKYTVNKTGQVPEI